MILTIAISCLLSQDFNTELEIIEQIKNFKKHIPSKIKNEIEIIFCYPVPKDKDFELLQKVLILK